MRIHFSGMDYTVHTVCFWLDKKNRRIRVVQELEHWSCCILSMSQCLLSTAPGVCALGWVKCREHISLLIIICTIVYVTNKAHLSLICIVFVLYICNSLTMVVQKNHLLGNQTTLAVLFVSDNHLIMFYGLDSLKTNGS